MSYGVILKSLALDFSFKINVLQMVKHHFDYYCAGPGLTLNGIIYIIYIYKERLKNNYDNNLFTSLYNSGHKIIE